MVTSNLGIIVYIWYPGNWMECLNPDTGNVMDTPCGSYNSSCGINNTTCTRHDGISSWAGRYKPDKGLYSSNDVGVIAGQVADIKRMGCGFVALSYWNSSEKSEPHGVYKAWADYLTSIGETQLKVCPYYEDANHKSISTIESDLTYLIGVAGSHAYMINGKPVVFAYGSGAAYLNDWGKIRTDKGIYLIQKGESVGNKSVADLYHPYAPAGRAVKAGTDGYALSPGFWRYHSLSRLDRIDLMNNGAGNWAVWENEVIAMKNSGCAIMTVQTYNEWQEDSGIEPAAHYNHLEGGVSFTKKYNSYGTKYIDILGKYFGGTGGNGTGGCINPVCTLTVGMG